MQYKHEYEEFRILILGDNHVGKTTLVQKFVGAPDPHKYEATDGVAQEVKSLEFADKKVNLRIWDATGTLKLWPMVETYLPFINGAFVCFDLTNLDSFNNVTTHVEEIRKFRKKEFPKETPVILGDVPIILVACKADLQERRCVSAEMIKKLAIKLNISYLETSSLKKININTVFIQLIERMCYAADLAAVRPKLDKQLSDYLQAYRKTTNQSLFRTGSSEERLLRHKYQAILKDLFAEATPQALDIFVIKVHAIITTENQLFHDENRVLSEIKSSRLVQILKQALVDLKHLVDLPQEIEETLALSPGK